MTTTSTWSNFAGGAWSTPGNWIGGVPTGANALIDGPSSAAYTITVSNNQSPANVTLDDVNATLAIATGGAFTPTNLFFEAGTLALTGSMTNATIVNSGGTNTVLTTSGGTLSGDTWQGSLNITAGSLAIANGITVTDVAGTGSGTINLGPATLAFTNSTALSGASGTQSLTINAAPNATIQQTNANTTLILAEGASIVQSGTVAGTEYFVGAGSIDNQSTIASNGVNGGGISITSNVFTNDTTGLISIQGDALSANGNVFINDGSILSGALTFNVSFTNNGTITASSLSGNAYQGVFVNAGTINVTSSSGTVTNGATSSNTGVINLAAGSGLTFTGAISGAGQFNIGNFATLEVGPATGTVDFQATRGILAVGTAETLAATVLGFRKATSGTSADDIDLVNQGTFVSENFVGTTTGGQLTVVTNVGTNVINLSGADYTAADGVTFSHTTDGNNGLFITTSQTACFLAGTLIRTARGEVAVEDLREGDVAITVSGTEPHERPVRWIGRSRIDLDRHPQADRVAPVRIQAGAFGPALPVRDLLLSPDHALFVHEDGPALVAAGDLVDEDTITREPARGVVTYFHVELDAHDALLANGLPAESYLDTGNRTSFANCGVSDLFPVFAPGSVARAPCAEYLARGPRLESIRNRLLATRERVATAA